MGSDGCENKEPPILWWLFCRVLEVVCFEWWLFCVEVLFVVVFVGRIWYCWLFPFACKKKKLTESLLFLVLAQRLISQSVQQRQQQQQ